MKFIIKHYINSFELCHWHSLNIETLDETKKTYIAFDTKD